MCFVEVAVHPSSATWRMEKPNFSRPYLSNDRANVTVAVSRLSIVCHGCIVANGYGVEENFTQIISYVT